MSGRIPWLKRVLPQLGLLGLVGFAVGCPPTPPAGGDFQILLLNQVLFDYPVAQDPVVFNAGQLQTAPFLPMNAESVKYQDDFSTGSSQTYWSFPRSAAVGSVTC